MTIESATLDDMSQDAISRLILDQLRSLREEVKQDIHEVRESFRDVNEDLKGIRDDIGEIRDELGNRGGIRDRLTGLEIKTQQAIDCSTAQSYPPPSSKKKSVKDHAPAVIAGGGSAGILYMLVELANTLLKTK